MNTNNENGNSEILEVEGGLVKPADDASQEDKDAYHDKLESTNRQLFARAKKAEGFVLKDGKWVKPEAINKDENKGTNSNNSSQESGISQSDLITIIKANVPEEDISEVTDYAKMKGITIKEALNSPIIRETLKINAENRAAADASHTGAQRRTSAPTGDSILQNAGEGKLPDSVDGMTKLAEARMERKKASLKNNK